MAILRTRSADLTKAKNAKKAQKETQADRAVFGHHKFQQQRKENIMRSKSFIQKENVAKQAAAVEESIKKNAASTTRLDPAVWMGL